jgi:peptide/nickel transport system substrate-binding protein
MPTKSRSRTPLRPVNPRRGNSAGVTRGRRLRSLLALLPLAGLIPAVTLTSATPAAAAGASRTLTTAWLADDQPPDPATFYGGEGFELQNALYDGLVQYAPNSTTVVPDLATSWSISPDGLTYTFHLRTGATFHDGTPVNAAAVIYSFQREIKLAGAPSYMLASVSGMTAPDPQTVVITLSAATNQFIQFMASYVGPKVVSPTTVNANLGTDEGQTYLATHDAGSGPYVMTSYLPNQSIHLKAYPGFWGTKPYYTAVTINIVSSIETQELELQKGQLDAISYSIPGSDIARLQSTSNLKVWSFPAVYKSLVWINPRGPLGSLAVRQAVRQAIDKKIITTSAYGKFASVSTQMVPPGTLPSGQGLDNPKYDPSVLKGLVAKLSDKHITIGTLPGDPTDNLAGELIQTELQAAGLTVTGKTVSASAAYSMPGHPNTAPSLLVLSVNSDDLSPGTWLHEYFSTTGALNFMTVNVTNADNALTAANSLLSPTAANSGYSKSAELYAASGDFMSLSNLTTVIAANKSITHIGHSYDDPFGMIFNLTK